MDKNKLKSAAEFMIERTQSKLDDYSHINSENTSQMARFLCETYFHMPSNGRALIFKEGNFGQMIEVSWQVIEQEFQMLYGRERTFNSKLFSRDDKGDFAAKHLLFHIANQEYRPLAPHLFETGGALVLNRWKPSGFRSDVHTNTIKDLSPWEELLERLFPIPEQRQYFEEWLAVTVIRPDIQIPVCPLIRSDQGTGKDFFANEVLGPLVGKANYKNGSLEQITATHADEIRFSTVIVINEMYKGKSKTTANRLKEILTGRTAQINPKGLPAFRMEVFSNFIIFSNSDDPVFIEEGDRRYWVPQRMVHPFNVDETNGFLQKTLLPWLKTDGLQAIWQRLYDIANRLPENHFAKAPDTEEKEEITHVNMKPTWKEELQADLEQARGYWYSLDEIKDWRCAKNKLSQPEIVAILRQEGWDWRRKPEGRRWGYLPKAGK